MIIDNGWNKKFKFFVQHIHILRASEGHCLHYQVHISSVLTLKVNIENC